MMIPTVHLNGTSKQALIDEVEHALDTLDSTIRALNDMTVNGRDYYPQVRSDNPEAYRTALAEAAARIATLRVMQTELQEYKAGIDAQGRRR